MLEEKAKVEGGGWKVPPFDPGGKSIDITDLSEVEWVPLKAIILSSQRSSPAFSRFLQPYGPRNKNVVSAIK
jgi:hypothetical protein